MTDDSPAAATSLDHAPAAPVPAPARTRRASQAAESRRRLSVFIHEPFGAPRKTGLRVGVIADGTSRGGPNGIAEGALRVVECAERCAERGDVGSFAAFILSPQNLARRQTAFFAALHAEFLRLVEKVASERALAGIRIEIHGRLDRLARKGGAATRLAHVLELLCDTTAAITSPRLRLVFCVDYDEDTPLTLGLDLLLRTGMEEPRVLRLSGLRVQPHTVCIPYVKLWRDFTVSDLDGALALAARQARPGLAPGFSSAFIAEFLAELARADLPGPLQITLPLAASAGETAALLESIASGATPAPGVEVFAELGPRGALRRAGPRRAPVQVQLVTPGLRRLTLPGDPVAWLAPGQPGPVFHLLERSAGDANVHTCAPTPAGIVEGLRQALGFQVAHPPLHGAPRAVQRDALGNDRERIENLIDYVSGRLDTPAGDVARALDGRDQPGPGRIGEVFAAARLAEARAAGLFSGEVDWRRQAFGYAMTAFAIGFRAPAAGSDWEPAARAVAGVMLALGSSDEEITDRVFPGESHRARRNRLAISIEYLIARIHGEPRDPPRVHGREVLAALGRAWERFFAQVAPAADAGILAGVKQAAEALYRATLEELARTDPLLAKLERRPSARTADAVERRHASAAEPVARRIRELLQDVRFDSGRVSQESWRELRLLCRLSRVAPSIGAGCALLAMAATEPAHAIPAGGAAALLRAMPLVDSYFRLANDLSFVDATRGDRDGKSNTFTCLVPARLTGKAREQACVDALHTCWATAARLKELIRVAVGELARLWPRGANWLERGIHVGRRAYEIGHYERLTPQALTGILAEIEPHA